MKTPEMFWDKIAPRYAKSKMRDVASCEKKLAKTQEYFKPDWQVFEFGCGTGSTAIVHAPYVDTILATDVSGKMLEIAQEKASAAGVTNIRFQRGALNDLALTPDIFHAVLGLNILHLLVDAETAVAKVHQVLKPGGIFVSSTGLLLDMKFYWRLVIPVAQRLGIAPTLRYFTKDSLILLLTQQGFVVDYQWQPDKGSIFIIASKVDGPGRD